MNAPGNQKKNTEQGPDAVSGVSSANGAGIPSEAGAERYASALRPVHLLVIVLFIAALDQAVKAIVVHRLNLHDSYPVLKGILSLVRIHNSGIAFGLFPGMPDVFTVITLISMIAVFYFYMSVSPKGFLLTVGCALIIGGALGNLIDRFRLGYVVDYIYFSFWPAFNVADSAVSVGVVMLMISFFRAEKGVRNASDTG